MSRFIASCLATAIALLAIPATSTGVVLCARQRGDGTFSSTIKIREHCSGRETALDLAALGLQGPRGPHGPGTTVKDASGALVGVVTSAIPGEPPWSDVWVSRQVDGSTTLLKVRTEGVGQTHDAISLYYESADCSGAGYVDSTFDTPLLSVARVLRGPHAFFPIGSSRTIVFGSFAQVGPEFTTCLGNATHIPPDRCCTVAVCGGGQPCQSTSVARVVEVDLSNLIPPFHVELGSP